MKLFIIFITIFSLSYSSDEFSKKYTLPEFYSKGFLPENYTFVCIDSEKWLQHEEPDKIVLEKLYQEDSETGEITEEKCELN